jgi:hypothetical protein
MLEKVAAGRLEAFNTNRFHAKRGVTLTSRGRSPDSQVIANSGYLPIPYEQWSKCRIRSLFTVAQPCGILTRFPFHSPVEGKHLRTVSTSSTMRINRSMPSLTRKTLEDEFQAELNLPVVVLGRTDSSKRRRGQHRVRVAERRRIKQIEKFRTEL